MTVQVDPNPLVETGTSNIAPVIQVETSPSLAGDPVEISSSQLDASCGGILSWLSLSGVGNFDVIVLPLDNDGNATVFVIGNNCAPGQSVIDASLTVAPYYTALATLNAAPPVVTTSGVYGYPRSSGTVTGGEVETGDTNSFLGGSSVDGVFYVETDPVYAEQTVEISPPELQARCGTQWVWSPLDAPGQVTYGTGSTIGSANTTATATLDNDGNDVFYFEGASCAAGYSVVTADVEAGSHPTYTTTFNVLPPQPTI
jgi:hypothetical protein